MLVTVITFLGILKSDTVYRSSTKKITNNITFTFVCVIRSWSGNGFLKNQKFKEKIY